jgi:hypothetical protein
MHVLFLSTTSWTLIILRSIQRDIVIIVHRSPCKVPIFVRFKWSPDFLDGVSRISQISDFIKILLVGAELFHVDRQTDGRTEMTKLFAIRNFMNAPKMGSFHTYYIRIVKIC